MAGKGVFLLTKLLNLSGSLILTEPQNRNRMSGITQQLSIFPVFTPNAVFFIKPYGNKVHF